jgi:hypothetical protein
MKRRQKSFVWLLILSIVGSGIPGAFASGKNVFLQEPETFSATLPTREHKKSAAYEWLDVALEATAREHERYGARPTIGSRMLAIIVTSMYDAWAAYDDKAVGTRFGDKLRRPKSERTLANKEKAIAYATYRAMLYIFSDDTQWIKDQFSKRGLNPDDNTTDLSKPQGVGNVAAAAVI